MSRYASSIKGRTVVRVEAGWVRESPLRLARDLASKKRSPLRPEIINGIFTLCDAVHWTYSSNADRPWFTKTIRNAQDAARRKPHPQPDSSASDSSVEVLDSARETNPRADGGTPKE